MCSIGGGNRSDSQDFSVRTMVFHAFYLCRSVSIKASYRQCPPASAQAVSHLLSDCCFRRPITDWLCCKPRAPLCIPFLSKVGLRGNPCTPSSSPQQHLRVVTISTLPLTMSACCEFVVACHVHRQRRTLLTLLRRCPCTRSNG